MRQTSARLEQWAADFNARRAESACNLFSKELIATFRGEGDTGYEHRCKLIKKALEDTARTYRYDLDLEWVIVEGNLGVARPNWTLHVMPGDIRSREPGMVVFRKEADGKWRIIRYIAYDEN